MNRLLAVDKPATDAGESTMLPGSDTPMRMSPDGCDLAIRNRDDQYFPWRVTDGSQRADKQVEDWPPVAVVLATERKPIGYVIAERHAYGPDRGRLDADWDGLIHETREAADAELALANTSTEDSPAEVTHWKLYELREVRP